MFNRLKAGVLSAGYRWQRARLIEREFNRQYEGMEPRDFEKVVELGREKLKALPDWMVRFPVPDGIERRLYDVVFPSPVTIGAFEGDLGVLEVYVKLGAGGVTTKTAMEDNRAGNERPRWQQVKSRGVEHSLNAIGLPGPGIDEFASELSSSPLWSYGRPVGVSVGGSSVDEYLRNFRKCYEAAKGKGQHYFEINISCPNTPEGQQMSRHPELLHNLLIDMRRVDTDAVIGVKLSPDMRDEDILDFARLVKPFGRTFLNLGNTSYRSCHEVGLPEGAISIGGGGYSGPELFSRTLEMNKMIGEMVPTIATGGVSSLSQVERVLEEATLVGVVTAVGKDVYNIPKWNYGLVR